MTSPIAQSPDRQITTSFFVRGDIDGFFGLFIDNLLQLMLIGVLCTQVCGLPGELVTGRILPAAALSILFGNLFYSWQAWQLMKRTGRTDITALPYGINTPSLLAYIFLIMAPVYRQTGDATLAWQAGLFACLVSGLMETAAAFCGDWLRRNTPRAALLSALAGIAITFIAMNFIFQLFASPGIAVLPMLIILVVYAARVRLPLGVPGGLLAVLVGMALAWGLHAMGLREFVAPPEAFSFAVYWPIPVVADVFALAGSPTGWQYMSVIVPMGLFNVIGSLQNLESAEAAGDRYETRPSLLVNGLGTLVAAVFGSAFPTTIYIGHPGWKAMGARAGYSILNGVVIAALCLIGGMTLVLRVVPIEATLGILLWIGIIITAQAFEAVPRAHLPAVALGLIPAFAAWGLEMLVKPCLLIGGVSLADAAAPLQRSGIYLNGMIALSQGFILSSMMFAAILAFVIDRRFAKAAGWTLATAALSAVGLIHAYDLTPLGIENRFAPVVDNGRWVLMAAPAFALMYALAAGFLWSLHWRRKQ